jgi:hypothetical protein
VNALVEGQTAKLAQQYVVDVGVGPVPGIVGHTEVHEWTCCCDRLEENSNKYCEEQQRVHAPVYIWMPEDRTMWGPTTRMTVLETV